MNITEDSNRCTGQRDDHDSRASLRKHYSLSKQPGPALWLLLLGTYSDLLPRPFDDWKQALLDLGTVIALWCLTPRSLTPVVPGTVHGTWRVRLSLCWELLLALGIFAAALWSLTAPTAPTTEGIVALLQLGLWGGLALLLGRCGAPVWERFAPYAVIMMAGVCTLAWLAHHGVNLLPAYPDFLSPIGAMTLFSAIVALHVPLALHCWDGTASHWRRLGWGVCLLLLGSGLGIASTRASLLAAGIAFGTRMGLRRATCTGAHSSGPRGYHHLILMALVGLGIIVAPSLRGPPLLTRWSETIRFALSAPLTADQLDSLSSARWHSYRTTLTIIGEHPWRGIGLGSFRYVFPEYAHRRGPDGLAPASLWYPHPHNEPLLVAAEIGLPGLLLCMTLAAMLVRQALRALRTSPPATAAWIITALCGLVTAAVEWQFSTSGRYPLSRWLVAFYLGIVWATCRSAHRQSRDDTGTVRTVTAPVWGLRTLLVLAGLVLAAHHASLGLAHRAQRPLPGDSPGRSLRLARWAYQLSPGTFDATYTYATALAHTPDQPRFIALANRLYQQFPLVPVVLYVVGRACAQQGNLPAAVTHLEHALRNAPDFTLADELLRQIRK